MADEGDVEMESEEIGETADECDADAIDDADQPSEAEGQALRIHLSAGTDLRSLNQRRLEAWLRKLTSVEWAQMSKRPSKGYAFVEFHTQADLDQFKRDVDGQTCKSSTVHVAAATSRSQGVTASRIRRQEQERGDKRRRDDDEGERPSAAEDAEDVERPAKNLRSRFQITLPLLIDLLKKARNERNGATLNEKVSPLFKWSYPDQVTMKAQYVKTCVRQFTRGTFRHCENVGVAAPQWCVPDNAPAWIGCPLAEPIGCPPEGRRGYRNKCEFTISRTPEGDSEVGFVLTSRGNQPIVESAGDTIHVPTAMNELCHAFRATTHTHTHTYTGVEAGLHSIRPYCCLFVRCVGAEAARQPIPHLRAHSRDWGVAAADGAHVQGDTGDARRRAGAAPG